jgi:K+-transporting ATPase KdpF subunit
VVADGGGVASRDEFGETQMSAIYLFGGLLVAALFIYLLFALFNPEKF